VSEGIPTGNPDFWRETAEMYDAAVRADPERFAPPKRRRGSRTENQAWCEDCGADLFHNYGSRQPLRCVDHPAAPFVLKRRGLRWADNYLLRWAKGGGALADFVDAEWSERMYPGVSRADVALMASLRTRWGGWPGWELGEIPEPPRRENLLYGPKGGVQL
jgi:hypothetical protein